jgi:hypothetical protein
MAQPDDQDHAVRPGDRGWTRWLSAGSFVLGLLAGVLLVGLLGQDPPRAPTPGSATASAAGDPPASTAEPTGRVEVNAACLRAINAAQDIAAVVEDLGTAAAALDAAQLDEAIRRLQPLQERLQENTAACESTGSAPTDAALPSPTPSAPASPPD